MTFSEILYSLTRAKIKSPKFISRRRVRHKSGCQGVMIKSCYLGLCIVHSYMSSHVRMLDKTFINLEWAVVKANCMICALAAQVEQSG